MRTDVSGSGLSGSFDESSEKLLEGALGAHVNVIALASGAADFRRQVRKALNSTGLRIFEFGEIADLAERAARFEVDQSLKRLAKEVASTGRVSCGEFFVFTSKKGLSLRGIKKAKQ